MTEKEYLKALEKLADRFEQSPNLQIDKELEMLYEWKPVRLLWYVLHAKNVCRKSCNGWDFYGIISGSYAISHKYSDLLCCLKEMERVSTEVHNLFEVKHVQGICHALEGNTEDYATLEKVLRDADQELPNYEQNYKKLEQLYGVEETIPYLALYHRMCDQYSQAHELFAYDWICEQPNFGFYLEQLRKEQAFPFVVLESEYNMELVSSFIGDLKYFRRKVYWIKAPVKLNCSIEEAIQRSLLSERTTDGITVYETFQVSLPQGENTDTRSEILKAICNKTKCGLLNVVASGLVTDKLSMNSALNHHFNRLTAAKETARERNLAFSVYGDYLTYISDIYIEDCRKIIDQKSSLKFSIVIPARNSAATLRHTLRTCLEQTYTGNYEILISDNSQDGNNQVYELYLEMQNSKIRYMKTPRIFQLSKSFEYAYIHASGEYILAIGSDDGLLPWTLEVLDQVTEEYPDEKIIQWDRGFYAWPGFNGGQQNQFVIPKRYSKYSLNVKRIDCLTELTQALIDPKRVYILPMLYINSCFKRSFFRELLEKTGALWNGICQDIYMGVIVCCIEKELLKVQYPLTIAGMSSMSEGTLANKVEKDFQESQQGIQRRRNENNVGGFCKTFVERMIPENGTDVSSFYNSVMRAVKLGIFPLPDDEGAYSWKTIFYQIACLLDKRDPFCERKLEEMRYAAMQHGEQFYMWFYQEIYEPLLQPVYIQNDKPDKQPSDPPKTYKNEITPSGGIHCDASLYGVKNIYDAVKLFEKFIENPPENFETV